MSESLFQPDPTLAAMEAKLPDKPGPIIEPIGKRGPPRKLHPLRIGQLSMLLSFGFSHREAATWPEVSHGTISNLVADDVDFRQMVDRFSRLARVHPLMQLLRAQHKSWRASAWLIQHYEKRGGDCTPGETLEALTEMAEKAHKLLLVDDYFDGDAKEE